MPRFFIRNQKVYLRYNENYHTIRVSTGIKVPPGSKISAGNHTLVGRDRVSMVINTRLIDLFSQVKKILISDEPIEVRERKVKQLMDGPVHIPDERTMSLRNFLLKFVQDMESGIVLQRKGRKYSGSIIYSHRSIFNYVNRLYEDGLDYDLMENNIEAKPVETKRKIISSSNEYFSKILKLMQEDGLSVNTQSLYMLTINNVLKKAEAEFMIKLPRAISIEREENQVTVIPSTVFDEFLALDYNSIKGQDMKFCYEVSYVMLITSLRVSDAIRLTRDDISIVEGVPRLNGYLNAKTRERTNCPIPMRLYDILDGNFKKYGSVYSCSYTPKTAAAMCRRLLPELFKMLPSAGEQISLTKLNPDRTTYRRITKPLYDIVHPHMLRRSAVTNMLQKGVPERVIKYLTGHTQNSRAFERYVAYVEETFNDAILNYQKMIGG